MAPFTIATSFVRRKTRTPSPEAQDALVRARELATETVEYVEEICQNLRIRSSSNVR